MKTIEVKPKRIVHIHAIKDEWIGFATCNCPYCDRLIDLGTGYHFNTEEVDCEKCNKKFNVEYFLKK